MKKIDYSENKKAFTIIELLVIVVIIGILATIAIVNLTLAQKKARDSQRKADLTEIASALENYKTDKKVYIIASSYTNANSTNLAGLISGGYIARIPEDPNSTDTSPFYYQYYSPSPGSAFKLNSQPGETLPNCALQSSCTSDQISDAKNRAGEFYNPHDVKRFTIATSPSALSDW